MHYVTVLVACENKAAALAVKETFTGTFTKEMLKLPAIKKFETRMWPDKEPMILGLQNDTQKEEAPSGLHD